MKRKMKRERGAKLKNQVMQNTVADRCPVHPPAVISPPSQLSPIYALGMMFCRVEYPLG